MESITPTNEFVEIEGRQYLNPQTGLDESNAFIENLRATQAQQNQQIASDTYNLGTDIQSVQGGLGTNTPANMGYFTSRYQTPQTNSAVASLRAAAQASALNEVLSNEQAIWKKRYNDAYRNYQKRQNAKANSPVPTTPENPYANVEGEDPGYETTTPSGTAETSVSGLSGAYTIVDPVGNLQVVDMNTGDWETLYPGQSSKTRQNASAAVGGGQLRTLPNGNKVLVKPGYGLTKEGSQYYLVDSNGNRTAVGG